MTSPKELFKQGKEAVINWPREHPLESTLGTTFGIFAIGTIGALALSIPAKRIDNFYLRVAIQGMSFLVGIASIPGGIIVGDAVGRKILWDEAGNVIMRKNG